ncbi:hypothetical protein Acr_23g0020550 [Actinidia rufa]|uniref:Uncharacterized protein n=1 Tax=Actinidia rufa TaxID=165716 RepID=A0A7J0GS71_9ERIC|nr:hypothetical protein Acr_23g0020550 [Actinidia rufa]
MGTPTVAMASSEERTLARFHGLVLPRLRGFGDKQPPKRSWATNFVMVLGRRAYLSGEFYPTSIWLTGDRLGVPRLLIPCRDGRTKKPRLEMSEDDFAPPPTRLVNFVSEEQLAEARKTRGTRVDDGTGQRDRSLYEIIYCASKASFLSFSLKSSAPGLFNHPFHRSFQSLHRPGETQPMLDLEPNLFAHAAFEKEVINRLIRCPT